MEKEFVPYQESLELKELGFDERCFGFYTYKGEIRRYTDFDGELNEFQTLKNSNITMGDGWCTTPTFSQAFRFFRENHNLHYEIEYNGYEYLGYVSGMTANIFKTYEEAELACLKKLIEIVKNKI